MVLCSLMYCVLCRPALALPWAPTTNGRGLRSLYIARSAIGNWLPRPGRRVIGSRPLESSVASCQFTARNIRGRSRPPVWYPGFPLYVRSSQYRERTFVKIENWNSRGPEEVRKSADLMPIYPFEAPVFPRRYPSPFLTGGLGESVENAEGDRQGCGIGRK